MLPSPEEEVPHDSIHTGGGKRVDLLCRMTDVLKSVIVDAGLWKRKRLSPWKNWHSHVRITLLQTRCFVECGHSCWLNTAAVVISVALAVGNIKVVAQCRRETFEQVGEPVSVSQLVK